MYGIFTYICHILPLKTTIHVGKYTVRPMDGMGIVTTQTPPQGNPESAMGIHL